MDDLPPRYACRFCGRPVDPDSQTCYRRVTGWLPAGRAAGRTIALPEPEPGWACKPCIDIRTRTGPAQTETLF